MVLRSPVFILALLVAFAAPVSAGSQGTDEESCRVVGTHLLDPRVPMTEWVRPDPDGCFQRVIYYVLTTVGGVVNIVEDLVVDPVEDLVQGILEDLCPTCPSS